MKLLLTDGQVAAAAYQGPASTVFDCLYSAVNHSTAADVLMDVHLYDI
jgi:hypothetical protein